MLCFHCKDCVSLLSNRAYQSNRLKSLEVVSLFLLCSNCEEDVPSEGHSQYWKNISHSKCTVIPGQNRTLIGDHICTTFKLWRDDSVGIVDGYVTGGHRWWRYSWDAWQSAGWVTLRPLVFTSVAVAYALPAIVVLYWCENKGHPTGTCPAP